MLMKPQCSVPWPKIVQEPGTVTYNELLYNLKLPQFASEACLSHQLSPHTSFCHNTTAEHHSATQALNSPQRD
jgi:hypothetical protein